MFESAKIRTTLISCAAVIGAWATMRLTFVSDVHPSLIEKLSSPLLWVVAPIAGGPVRAIAPQMVDLTALGIVVLGNAAIYGVTAYWTLRLFRSAKSGDNGSLIGKK
jgi:hypothetical protein